MSQTTEVRASAAVEPRYGTVGDAARYSSLSERTLYYALAKGELKAFRVGRRVLISFEDLDAYIRSKAR